MKKRESWPFSRHFEKNRRTIPIKIRAKPAPTCRGGLSCFYVLLAACAAADFWGMTTENAELKAAIAAEMEEWAANYVRARADFLRKKKIDATGSLVRSLQYEMNQQARAEAIELLLAFEEHGRFVDMKTLSPSAGGGDYVAAIEAWIQQKGLATKFTNKFMEKYGKKTVPANVLNKIAWGIVTKRGFGKARKRAWYNRSRTAAVADLYNDVAALLPDLVSSQIAKNLTPKPQ